MFKRNYYTHNTASTKGPLLSIFEYCVLLGHLDSSNPLSNVGTMYALGKKKTSKESQDRKMVKHWQKSFSGNDQTTVVWDPNNFLAVLLEG